MYNIFSDYSFTSDNIKGIDTNFQFNFSNCIYKFYNRFIPYINKYNTYNFDKLKLNYKEIYLLTKEYITNDKSKYMIQYYKIDSYSLRKCFGSSKALFA